MEGPSTPEALGKTSEIPHLLSPNVDDHSSESSSDRSTHTHTAVEASSPKSPSSPKEVKDEDDLCYALGISIIQPPESPGLGGAGGEGRDGEGGAVAAGGPPEDLQYDIVPNPEADEVDLSVLRGTRAPLSAKEKMRAVHDEERGEDLDALAELVPGLKNRASPLNQGEGNGSSPQDRAPNGDGGNVPDGGDDLKLPAAEANAAVTPPKSGTGAPAAAYDKTQRGVVDDDEGELEPQSKGSADLRWSTQKVMSASHIDQHPPHIENLDSMQVQRSLEDEDEDLNGNGNSGNKVRDSMATLPENGEMVASAGEHHDDTGIFAAATMGAEENDDESSTSTSDSSLEVGDEVGDDNFDNEEQNLGGFEAGNADNSSDDALRDSSSDGRNDSNRLGRESKPRPAPRPDKDFRGAPSSASLSTATQTHEVRMPMYLPTFKPATGCTNASDFIVRCFVARLRSGITVVKHGRSRWCKSRLRILHVHSDGRSLSWKPALGEPTSSKRPPKLDLSTCMEVRHAWSPDPLNPMFTGTPILRQKCEAANAHKSFALIFPKRTVDITAVTADQCKVLMEGFSALCFRLQVANLAGRGGKKAGKDGETRGPGEEEDGTTASVTLTNNSTTISPTNSSGGGRQRRSTYR